MPTWKWFSFTDAEKAPEAPGLYAWYAVAAIGRRDWEQDIGPDGDRGQERLMKLLVNHTRRFANAELKIRATSSFDTTWAGFLKDKGMERLATFLSQDENTDGETPEGNIHSVVANQNLRGVFANILNYDEANRVTNAEPGYFWEIEPAGPPRS